MLWDYISNNGYIAELSTLVLPLTQRVTHDYMERGKNAYPTAPLSPSDIEIKAWSCIWWGHISFSEPSFWWYSPNPNKSFIFRWTAWLDLLLIKGVKGEKEETVASVSLRLQRMSSLGMIDCNLYKVIKSEWCTPGKDDACSPSTCSWCASWDWWSNGHRVLGGGEGWWKGVDQLKVALTKL